MFLGTDFEAVAFCTQYFNRAYQVWDCLQALPLAASEEGVANAAAAVLVAAALVAGRNHLHKANYTTTVEMKALGSTCSMSSWCWNAHKLRRSVPRHSRRCLACLLI